MSLPLKPGPGRLRAFKILVFVLAALPLVRLLVLGVTDRLGANPVEFVIRSNGTWTLTFLLITLSITPLRRLTGMNWLLSLRRMLGLYTFFYAMLHFLSYIWLDQWFDLGAVVRDVAKHRYVLAGFAAFLLLIPLAMTSTNAMMRRLGKRWQKLHQLVYLVALLGIVHYWWLIKKDVTLPLLYTLALGLLLGARIFHKLGPVAMPARR